MNAGVIKSLTGIFQILFLTVVFQNCASTEFDYLYKNLPFGMEKVSRPDIPEREILLTDFGGIGDGIAMNTGAFASAIDYLSSQGGGRLTVPEGIWLTGPITLKDNIDLHVTPNAVILFSWSIALAEYSFQVPANRIGFSGNGGPFSLMQLKVIQEVVTLVVFTLFTTIFFKGESLHWNHFAAFVCLVLAVYFVFCKG